MILRAVVTGAKAFVEARVKGLANIIQGRSKTTTKSGLDWTRALSEGQVLTKEAKLPWPATLTLSLQSRRIYMAWWGHSFRQCGGTPT